MLEEEVKNNLVIYGEVVKIYTKNPLWIPIPIEGELCVAFLIRKERIFKLGSLNYKELLFKTFEVRSEELEGSFLRLAIKGNPLSLPNIFYLE